MKNLFKKSVKKEVKSTIQKLEKNQLEKVIGGATAIVKQIATAEGPR
jgi:hypothetical protein